MTQLKEITHLIIDMDGVLYRGDHPMPGLPSFMTFLQQRPIPYMMATNNSTRSPAQYVDKLATMGVTISADQVLTSGTATARFLRRDLPAGTRVHLFGMDSVRQALQDEGFILADEDVAAVVATMDLNVNYEKLRRAVVLIRQGARFVATNLDPTRPAPDGMLWPGTGSLIAAIRTGAETDPIVVGKPEPTMFELALEAMGARPESTAMLGDRLDTDILGAQRAGLKTILVLSGSSTAEEAEAYRPDFIFQDIAHLLAAWQKDLGLG